MSASIELNHIEFFNKKKKMRKKTTVQQLGYNENIISARCCIDMRKMFFFSIIAFTLTLYEQLRVSRA